MLGASREALAAGQERLEGLLATGGVDPAKLGEDLFSVTALLAGNAGLRRALTDPAKPADAKATLVDRLLTGQISGPALDLL